MKNKIILFILGLILSIGTIQAELAVSLNVDTAGTLSKLINSSEKYQITSLSLTGNLNGDDIRYIREMAGRDVDSYKTPGTLSVLDLSVAKIVSGGGYYYLNNYFIPHYTLDNCISDYMFRDCNRLTSVTIPSSVTSIGILAFKSCTGLTSFTIPNSVTSTEEAAFYGCTGLTSVTIANGVTSIGDHIFYGCTGLTSVTIPNSVTYIGMGAFYNCSGLTSVTIPNSVTSITEYTFEGCSGLTSVTIPDRVTSIKPWAFKSCSGIKSFTIPSSVTSLGNGAFNNCSGLTSVTIPNSITSIEENTFEGCTGLISVTIPGSVNYIGLFAFKSCTGLKSITIPGSVTRIGGLAFADCTGLSEIHCQIKAPQIIDSDVFFNVNKNTCILYVPKESAQIYKQLDVWKDFVNIVAESTTPINEVSLNKASISTLDNAIIIQNAHGETISVYTPSGKILRTVKATNGFIKIEVPENQTYLVKIANNTYKVALN